MKWLEAPVSTVIWKRVNSEMSLLAVVLRAVRKEKPMPSGGDGVDAVVVDSDVADAALL